jgi:hypothetical protein
MLNLCRPTNDDVKYLDFIEIKVACKLSYGTEVFLLCYLSHPLSLYIFLLCAGINSYFEVSKRRNSEGRDTAPSA